MTWRNPSKNTKTITNILFLPEYFPRSARKTGPQIFFSALRAENRPPNIFSALRAKNRTPNIFSALRAENRPPNILCALRAQNRTPNMCFRAPRAKQDFKYVLPRSARKTGLQIFFGGTASERESDARSGSERHPSVNQTPGVDCACLETPRWNFIASSESAWVESCQFLRFSTNSRNRGLCHPTQVLKLTGRKSKGPPAREVQWIVTGVPRSNETVPP